MFVIVCMDESRQLAENLRGNVRTDGQFGRLRIPLRGTACPCSTTQASSTAHHPSVQRTRLLLRDLRRSRVAVRGQELEVPVDQLIAMVAVGR